MAVFAESAGSSVAWHPQCFCCHKCKELLVDMIHFFSNGNVYCGRHYAELDGHRCSGCDEVSIYIIIKYMGHIHESPYVVDITYSKPKFYC
jgi:prickle